MATVLDSRTEVSAILAAQVADGGLVEQLLAVDPAEQSKRPRQRGAEPARVWTAGQMDAFLGTVRSHRLFAFYHLAASTGARRGELLYLRWQAVNLDAAEITFSGSTAVVGGQRIQGTTKGGRSRVISIDSDTVAVLRDHHRRQAEERLAAGSNWTDTNGLVFTTRWGEPLYPDTNGLVFTTRWGEPLYPDTVTALMTKLIRQHSKLSRPPPRRYRTPGCTICATRARPHCCLLGSRSTWWPPGSATQTQP